MRIKSIKANNITPIKRFEVDNLSDLVVVAGANGVGKTRLLNSILSHLQNPTSASIKFEIEATSEIELNTWKKKTLDTGNNSDATLFTQTLQQNQKRRNFRSSVLYYESDRTIAKIEPIKFSWNTPDPDEEKVGWNTAFGGLTKRFQDTQHAIFKKILSQKNGIASRAQELRKQGIKTMDLNFDDPLDPFRDAFFKLLGPKVLEDADIRNQIIRYKENSDIRDIKTLSSGESEVVKIVFDFILRQPSDCVIFFDEPELHLHPELSYKLINTLRSIGTNNQFILCTHSPEIISSSLEDTVVFVVPPDSENKNQAVIINQENKENESLRKLGYSIGVISLGKKIVLVEGVEASLDKKTYGSILNNRFPDLALVPSEGRHIITSFEAVTKNILSNSLWGIDFFMLTDRDAVDTSDSSNSNEKLKVLSKYHIENYFLDENVISKAMSSMEDPTSWLRDPVKIRAEFKNIAKSQISYAVALMTSKKFRRAVGNIDIMPKGIEQNSCEDLLSKIKIKVSEENSRFSSTLDLNHIEAYIKEIYLKFEDSIKNDDQYWKDNIPGRQIINIFCNKIKMPIGRFKNLYLSASSQDGHAVFKEIIDIFDSFSSY